MGMDEICYAHSSSSVDPIAQLASSLAMGNLLFFGTGFSQICCCCCPAGYGVQALSTGQGALGSLAVFGDSFNAAN